MRFLLIANTQDGGRLTGIGETLKRLGHEVLTFVQPSNAAYVSRAEVAEAAASFEADAVFTLDRVRTEISAAPDPIPFVTWDMGPLAHVREALRKNLVGTHDHLLLAAPEVAHAIGWPAARSHSFPTFANPAVVEAARTIGGPLPPVADVGFIGNFTGTAEQNVDLLRREHESDGAHVARAINRAYERLRAHTGDLPPPPRQLLETFRDALGAASDADPSRLYEQFLSQVAAPFYRLRTLEYLEQEGVALALFGAGWEKHPTLARFAKERLAGPPELAQAYLSTRVQLRLPFGRSLHPRLVDGAAIGACMVIRRSPSDFIGRIRRATQPLAAPTRPAKMTGEEWTYFLEELAMWGDPSLHGATLGVQRAGLDRAGVATDDVFAPELIDRISAANDQQLLETIVRLVENPDERREVADALRSSVEANLDPAVLLARIITEIASQEASRPSSMRPPPGFNMPVPSSDNKKMLAKSLRLL